MKISIRKPIGYSQIGRKDQQEDAVWPSFNDVSCDNPCIVLCDGVGGSKHGEVASQTTSKIIGEYLTKIIRDKGFVNETDVQEAVNQAYDELEKIDTEVTEEGTVSMATTLTCVCIHNSGILAAHMGDSRIYHIRPGLGLRYQSDDHSLVNALIKAGELTLEEAKNFPRKNVITKAIQPHGKKRFTAEVHQLTDVQAGDYLFLCCDGVLEQLTNEFLVEILSMECSDREKLSLLEAESTGKTKDNFTAYLIPIENVEGKPSLSLEDEISVDSVEVEINEKQNEPIEPARIQNHRTAVKKESRGTKKNLGYSKFLFILLIVVLLAAIALFYFRGKKESMPEEKTSTEQVDTVSVSLIESIKQMIFK